MSKEELIKTGEKLLAAKQEGESFFHEMEDVLPESILPIAEQWMEDLEIFQAKEGAAATIILKWLPIINGNRFFPEKVEHIIHILNEC